MPLSTIQVAWCRCSCRLQSVAGRGRVAAPSTSSCGSATQQTKDLNHSGHIVLPAHHVLSLRARDCCCARGDAARLVDLVRCCCGCHLVHPRFCVQVLHVKHFVAEVESPQHEQTDEFEPCGASFSPSCVPVSEPCQRRATWSAPGPMAAMGWRPPTELGRV